MLTEQQKQVVAQWFAAGASVAEIQKRVKDEMGIGLTYLDARLLVADLPQPTEPEPAPEPTPPATPADERTEVAPPEALPQEDAIPTSAAVSVDLDALTIPGTMASGSVVFSDGTKARWFLDQQGRMGLEDAPEGYQPSPADVQAFQQALLAKLRAKGLIP